MKDWPKTILVKVRIITERFWKKVFNMERESIKRTTSRTSKKVLWKKSWERGEESAELVLFKISEIESSGKDENKMCEILLTMLMYELLKHSILRKCLQILKKEIFFFLNRKEITLKNYHENVVTNLIHSGPTEFQETSSAGSFLLQSAIVWK